MPPQKLRGNIPTFRVVVSNHHPPIIHHPAKYPPHFSNKFKNSPFQTVSHPKPNITAHHSTSPQSQFKNQHRNPAHPSIPIIPVQTISDYIISMIKRITHTSILSILENPPRYLTFDQLSVYETEVLRIEVDVHIRDQFHAYRGSFPNFMDNHRATNIAPDNGC